MENYFQRYVVAGGIMMFFLIPTSIIAIALIIHGFIDLRRRKIMPLDIDEAFRASGGSARNLKAGLEQASESPLRRVCLRLLPMLKGKDESWDMTVQQVTTEEMASLYQRHGYLSICYGVAPLMGLLGTILGMVRAFSVFGETEVRSIGELGKGISEALLTTMWGLIIAVPSLLFLSLFRQRIYRYENDLIPARARGLFNEFEQAAKAEAKPAAKSADTVEHPLSLVEE